MLPAEPSESRPESHSLALISRECGKERGMKEREDSALQRGPAGTVPAPPLLHSLSPGRLWNLTRQVTPQVWISVAARERHWAPHGDETCQPRRAQLTQRFHLTDYHPPLPQPPPPPGYLRPARSLCCYNLACQPSAGVCTQITSNRDGDVCKAADQMVDHCPQKEAQLYSELKITAVDSDVLLLKESVVNWTSERVKIQKYNGIHLFWIIIRTFVSVFLNNTCTTSVMLLVENDCLTSKWEFVTHFKNAYSVAWFQLMTWFASVFNDTSSFLSAFTFHVVLSASY